MTLLEERVDVVEAKVDRLETLFGHFMSQTSVAIRRMDRAIERMENVIVEMRTEAAQDRENLNRVMAEMKDTIADMKAEAAQDHRRWNKCWGDLANRLGTLAEDIVAPNMPRIAREYFGFADVEDFVVRRKVRHKKDRARQWEFDVIVVGDEQVIINETKATARIEYIDDFIDVLAELADYMPEYASKTIIPVFASLYLSEDMVSYLTGHRIYAMAMGEETMTLLNFEQVHIMPPGGR